jgi:7,8-dihydro-6-hydroxymethylpterin-pyrophosphokinase
MAADRIGPGGADRPHRVTVALGSNLGDRQSFLRLAVSEIGVVTAACQMFETQPVHRSGGARENG